MYERNRNGEGFTHVQGIKRNGYNGMIETVTSKVEFSGARIMMDQSSLVMSAKPSATTDLFLIRVSVSLRIFRSSAFQIARSSSCCTSNSLPSAVTCSQIPNPLRISSVLIPSSKAIADEVLDLVPQLKEADRPSVRRPVLEGVEGPFDSLPTIPRVSNMFMISTNSVLEAAEKMSLDFDNSFVW